MRKLDKPIEQEFEPESAVIDGRTFKRVGQNSAVNLGEFNTRSHYATSSVYPERCLYKFAAIGGDISINAEGLEKALGFMPKDETKCVTGSTPGEIFLTLFSLRIPNDNESSNK